MTRQQADITVDLAAQACDQAYQAFARTAKLAPDPIIGLCISHLGAQILSHRMARIAKGAETFCSVFGIGDGTLEVKL